MPGGGRNRVHSLRDARTIPDISAEVEREPAVSRIVSFVVLVAIVAVFGVLFFRVMAAFLLPMFLATMLVIVFRPLHHWLVVRCRGRERLAAGLTTLAILLIVLLPLSFFVVQGAAEGWSIVSNLEQDVLLGRIARLRRRFGLELPPTEIREHLAAIDRGLAMLDVEPTPGFPMPDHREKTVPDLLRLVERVRAWSSDPDHLASVAPPTAPDAPGDAAVAQLRPQLALLDERLRELGELDRDAANFAGKLRQAREAQQEVKTALLGDPVVYWLRAKANPTTEELGSVRDWLQRLLAPAALEVTPVLLQILVGLGIMTISLYYFLADGPAMIAVVMKLSPLEEAYEKELLNEFGKITRAVVSATLLSAVVQGVLAGIGFQLAGIDAVFLLSVLTMFGAMIPFVGAAVVWIPCAAWLFIDGHPYAGIFLILYGALVVSMADNLIKPWILHGQSNLHPLLALLSVLGGVQALGPIGIFVGPMVVVFLQVLLQMLHTEMKAFEKRSAKK
jgi:predicted PurR-regulated permease PerM